MEASVALRPAVSAPTAQDSSLAAYTPSPPWNSDWTLPTPVWDWHSTVIFISFCIAFGYFCWQRRASLGYILGWILYIIHVRVRSVRAQAEIEVSMLNRNLTASVSASSAEIPSAENIEHTAIDMGQILDDDDHFHDCHE